MPQIVWSPPALPHIIPVVPFQDYKTVDCLYWVPFPAKNLLVWLFAERKRGITHCFRRSDRCGPCLLVDNGCGVISVAYKVHDRPTGFLWLNIFLYSCSWDHILMYKHFWMFRSGLRCFTDCLAGFCKWTFLFCYWDFSDIYWAKKCQPEVIKLNFKFLFLCWLTSSAFVVVEVERA